MPALRPVAVAVMAKAPGMTPVKSRLHAALTERAATDLYRCFLLDRLDGVAGIPGIQGILAYTPPEAASLMRALAPPGFRTVPQRGEGLTARLTAVLSELLDDGHAGAIAMDS